MSMSTESDEQSVEAAEPTQQEATANEAVPTPEVETEHTPAEPETAVPPAPETAVPVTEDEAAAELAAEAEPAENVPPKQKKKPAPKKRRKPTAKTSRKGQPHLRQVTERFAACGRCSYFWAGYRVIFGDEAQETAVAESQSGWLYLDWNLQMPELVHKAYGVRLDISYFHYEGCCKECRRQFIYEMSENEDEADSFCIEITPRTSK